MTDSLTHEHTLQLNGLLSQPKIGGTGREGVNIRRKTVTYFMYDPCTVIALFHVVTAKILTFAIFQQIITTSDRQL